MILWSALCILAISIARADASIKTHTCLPSSSQICLLHHVFYDHNNSITHQFPANQSYIRIGNDGWSKGIKSIVEVFDGQLYKKLDNPPTLEIMDAEMRTLEIPRKLRHGSFADNRLNWFSIESGEDEPSITYLDLSSNHIENITNISSLVNLETLDLSANGISDLSEHPLKNLKKLKFLYFNHNSLKEISDESFPQSLLYLSFYYNDIKTINMDLSLPLLETLNLERNQITHLEASALILSLPKVREILISGNSFPRDKLQDYAATFKRHNISILTDGDEASCYYHDIEIEGVCVQDHVISKGWLKATLLSVLTIIVAVIFVLVVLWVFRAMNK